MQKAILKNNAQHEAGHWLTGWLLGGGSTDIVLNMPANGKWGACCGRGEHPDFDDLTALNGHLGDRIINLIAGAKVESLTEDGFDPDIYSHLVSEGRGGWPDYFIASELFRYFYRSLPFATRKSFKEEWLDLVAKCEKIILENRKFISQVGELALERSMDGRTEIRLTRDELVGIFKESQ